MTIINQEFSDSLSSKDLEMFGLTNYEAKTYFNMLPLGLTKAKDISNISNIPFGRIYEVLTSLEHKGLLKKQDSRP
ncbi:MAG: helix-turn-helix domain-containing protein, partial [Candidatus Heimdallarchaeota archaeon]